MGRRRRVRSRARRRAQRQGPLQQNEWRDSWLRPSLRAVEIPFAGDPAARVPEIPVRKHRGMKPMTLSDKPPRKPRAELAGVVFLPRSIDKVRATLPGGDP